MSVGRTCSHHAFAVSPLDFSSVGRTGYHRASAVSPLDFSSVSRTGFRRASGHRFSRRDYSSSGLHRFYCAYAVHQDAQSRRSTFRQSVALAHAVYPVIPLCVMTTRLAAATDILHLRCASGRLGTSRDSSRGSSRRSSSTTPPRAGPSSTTSPPSRVRVPRHVAWLVTRLVAPIVVDYSASRRLVVNYFASAARPGASARHAARLAARRRLLRLTQARHRLLQLRRASGCLSTSRGTSRGSSRRSSSTTPPRASSSSTTSPPPRVRVPRHVAWLVTRLVAPIVVDYSASRRLVVNYFASAARPGASARHAARLAARRRLLRLTQARHRLLRLRRASGCLSTSRGSSRGSSRRSSSTTPPRASSSSTTSPPPRVRVPRHIARLVTRLVAPIVVDYSASRRLVVNYFASAARLGASARRAARHGACRAARRRVLHLMQAPHRLFRLRCASGCLGTLRGSSRGSSRCSSSTTPPPAASSSTT
jgi:hypothetical protein